MHNCTSEPCAARGAARGPVLLHRALAWLCAAALLVVLQGHALAQSSAFVYQGRLTDQAMVPAEGEHDMLFTLWDAPIGGGELGAVGIGGIDVVDGLFAATLDFGLGPFSGDDLFLEIAVKRSSDADYTTLAPRQPIGSAPYAIRSLQAEAADSAAFTSDAGMLGGLPPSEFLRVAGSGASLTDLDAGALATGTVAEARLPATVARTNASQTFTGNQAISGGLSVSGNLSVGGTLTAGTTVARIFQVAPFASTAWAIDAPSDYVSGSNQNPTLVLQRGLTYQFAVSAPGHPFRIATSNGGPAFNVGVVNNDLQTGVLTFKVPMDAPATLFYYCLVHPGMSGTISIQ